MAAWFSLISEINVNFACVQMYNEGLDRIQFSDNCVSCPMIVSVISAVYEVVCWFEIVVKCRVFCPE